METISDEQDLAVMAEILRASGRYRVQHRLEPRRTLRVPEGSATRSALFVDVETTGLDPSKDEIIELAMVPFTYGLDGRIFEIGEPFDQLQQPERPIPANITHLTGITDAMVAGQHIDPAEVSAFASSADLVIAHNAAFDRRFVEGIGEVFTAKPWACSMSQIDWADEGYEGTRLGYLATGAGFFYDRHRAVNDCHAAIELWRQTYQERAFQLCYSCSTKLADRLGGFGRKTRRLISRTP
jgi:DNA polymerase III subunit epsilon